LENVEREDAPAAILLKAAGASLVNQTSRPQSPDRGRLSFGAPGRGLTGALITTIHIDIM
jgi:hypothetical protein